MAAEQNNSQALEGWICQKISVGLRLLFEAYIYAKECSCDRSQLFVSLAELEENGLDLIDCRWMIFQGILEHHSETTFPGDKCRTFRFGDAILDRRSVFMLTEHGFARAQSILNERYKSAINSSEGTHTRTTLPSPTKVERLPPIWDMDRHELWYLGQLIKQFRLPSPNQIAILSAFQEEGWPPRIDDPLPFHAEIDPRRRLNDAIRNLNRSRLQKTIRFSGDGSGEGILWEEESLF